MSLFSWSLFTRCPDALMSCTVLRSSSAVPRNLGDCLYSRLSDTGLPDRCSSGECAEMCSSTPHWLYVVCSNAVSIRPIYVTCLFRRFSPISSTPILSTPTFFTILHSDLSLGWRNIRSTVSFRLLRL